MTERQKIVAKVIKVFIEAQGDLDVMYDADRNTLYVEDKKFFFNEKDEVVKVIDYTNNTVTEA